MKNKIVKLLCLSLISSSLLTGCGFNFSVGEEKPLSEAVQEMTDNVQETKDADDPQKVQQEAADVGITQTEKSDDIVISNDGYVEYDYILDNYGMTKFYLRRGYKMDVKEGTSAFTILDADSNAIITGDVFTPENYLAYANEVSSHPDVLSEKKIGDKIFTLVDKQANTSGNYAIFAYMNEVGLDLGLYMESNTGSADAFDAIIKFMGDPVESTLDKVTLTQDQAQSTTSDTVEDPVTATDEAPAATETDANTDVDISALPNDFSVTYAGDFFTDYSNGTYEVRINKTDVDSDLVGYLNGTKTDYYGVYDLSTALVQNIEGYDMTVIEGTSISSDTPVYRYFVICEKDGVKKCVEIAAANGSQLEEKDYLSLLKTFTTYIS